MNTGRMDAPRPPISLAKSIGERGGNDQRGKRMPWISHTDYLMVPSKVGHGRSEYPIHFIADRAIQVTGARKGISVGHKENQHEF